MGDVKKEVKIAEKLKFWEEQDQINKELIPRVVKNHEMITDLAYQHEKTLCSISLVQTNIDDMQNDIKNLQKVNSEVSMRINQLSEVVSRLEGINSVIVEQGEQINHLKQKLNEIQQVANDIRNPKGRETAVFKSKTHSSLLMGIGIASAIILSIIGLII